MKHQQQHWLWIAFLLFIVSGCASQPKVFTDYDDRRDFSAYKNFAWVHVPPMMHSGDYEVSALAEQRITQAIKGELISKGFVFVDDLSNADFSVVFTMGARDKIQVHRYSTTYYQARHNWGWGSYYFPYFVHFPFDYHDQIYYRDVPVSYTEGSIAVDIFDARSKEPIWHSKASKNLTKKDIRSGGTNAVEVIEKLMANFPPSQPANISSPWIDPENQ